MSEDAGVFPECEVNTLITPDRTTVHVRDLGRVESELVGLTAKVLARAATRRLRFVVHPAGWLHSVVLYGR